MSFLTPERPDSILIHEWVTGGGLAGRPIPPSWQAEGAAMRRALAREFVALANVQVVQTLDERFPAEPGPWTIERIGPGEEPDRFRDLIIESDYTLAIAPESGGILAGRARMLEWAGVNSLGAREEAIERTSDKLRLAELWTRKHLPTPECRAVRPAQGLPADFPYPAVLKPIDGAGCLNTFFIASPAAVPEEARGLPLALLQRFVSGTPLSASFLVNFVGVAALLGIGRQHIERAGCRLVYRGGTLPVSCEVNERILIRALEVVYGLHGFVGLDFVWNEATRELALIEINPRPTTSLVGLLHLLPPGWLARAWIEERAQDVDWPEALAQPRAGSSTVSFLPDGTIVSPS